MRDVLVIIGASVGVAGLVLNVLSRRAAKLATKRDELKVIRRYVRDNLGALTTVALESSPPSWLHADLPLLTRPGWVLDRPGELESLTLRWNGTSGSDKWQAAKVRASRLLPVVEGGRGRLAYSEAIVEIGGATSLFNGPVYRLEDISSGPSGVLLDFVQGSYFDYLDTSEVLAYEAGAILRGSKRTLRGAGYRRWLGDPFDLANRATSVGVVTLTIRKSTMGCGFYLHQRSSTNVTVGSGQVHVVPAGEFTPADLSQPATRRDLVLWHNMMREYAEEFLGLPESYGQSGTSPDYLNDSPYAELNRARQAGALKCYVFGVGLDPLTWKPEILTCCVFDSSVFDALFMPSVLTRSVPQAVTGTPSGIAEGIILSGAHGHGLPFSDESVADYAYNERMRPAGRACLRLAWRHRKLLDIAPIGT